MRPIEATSEESTSRDLDSPGMVQGAEQHAVLDNIGDAVDALSTEQSSTHAKRIPKW